MNPFKKIAKFFRPSRNSYLASHGFYEEKEALKKTPGKYPMLPFSLADLLLTQGMKDLVCFVSYHWRNAKWLDNNDAKVFLGGHHNEGKYPDEPEKKLDILLIDSKRDLFRATSFLQRLNDGGVVIFVHDGHTFHADTAENYEKMCKQLEEAHFRKLVFNNPSIQGENMHGEIWYRDNNVLHI